ncbi:hypothetical protein ES319_A03G101400v1 [Gossypium barbadense]|uniref:Calcineurin-like phosphoesterase domain-containing protein n=2 Tax=Gossypium TaxID=3633 RepID=A0A5J5WFD4_GOSBA|nr:hypothetical protein ES319_A03G101400v1 [Gossypium barbadense]
MDGSCKHCLKWMWVACFYFEFMLVSAEFQRFQHPVKADGSLSFLVIGDWGRKGAYNQSQVALQVGENLGIDFVISTGDNFYEKGLATPYDPHFKHSFTNIYSANSLQKQWYSVLGNHDYRGDVQAQLSPILRKIDSRWLCLRSFLAYNVDMYINEHDHCLQHLSSITSPLQFFTSGGGSKAWKGDFDYLDGGGDDEIKFYYDGQGFMSVELTPTNAKIAFYDVSGDVLHSFSSNQLYYT